MLRRFVASILVLAFLASCAGRAAYPVAAYQYGDEKKSCERLRVEISNTTSEIEALLPDTYKTGENVALGVTGFFLIVPLFFMDFSDAERVEVNALRRRHNNLVAIAAEKECGFKDEEIPPFVPEKKETKDVEPASS